MTIPAKKLVVCLVMVLPSISIAQEHTGIVIDATTSHIIVTGRMTPANSAAARRDPRIRQLLRRHVALDEQYISTGRTSTLADDFDILGAKVAPETTITVQGQTTQVTENRKIDWSVPLGTGNVAPHQSPSKYGFNTNDQPDCVNDWVVFGLNVAGVTGGQANLVGINKLYSGVNPTGLCGATPNVNWAYNGSTAGGAILGSTIISLDGTKVAYVESTPNSSILHVLTWKAGQGTTATNAASPTAVGHCTATSSCLTSLTYSTTSTTTLSSVWVDYDSDHGYVASDDGKIYRISCIFLCALNANPSVNWVFPLPVAGTGGSLPVPAMPVYDGSTYLFVTDQLGEVWSINVLGATPVLAAGPVMVGGGGCTGANPPGRTGTPAPCQANGGSYGIPDPVLLVRDGANEEIFVFSGNDGVGGASAVVAELNYDLVLQAKDSVGIGSAGNTTTNVDLHSGQFDNTFWNDPTQGHLFLCGTGSSNTQPWDYWIGFTDYPVMSSQPTQATFANIPTAGDPCTGFTEFYNANLDLGGNANDHDLLMSGVIDPTNGVLITDDISNGSITGPLNFVFYPGGVSDIIVDNSSDAAQASGMYFSTLAVVSVGTCSNARCAVKLSQLDLE